MLAESYFKLAMLDPLTGLHNRRYAQERLMAEIARAQRHKSTLTVLMVDLDELKRINDNWGHAAGDLVLKTFGDRLSQAIRGSDLAARSAATNLWCCCRNAIRIRFSWCSTGWTNRWRFSLKSQKIQFRSPAGWTDYRYGRDTGRISRARRPRTVRRKTESRKNRLFLSLRKTRTVQFFGSFLEWQETVPSTFAGVHAAAT